MSTTVQPGRARARGNLALGALGLGAFVVGTAELVIVGILDLVAKDLKVSVGTAGLLVTAYALGICIGGPLLTVLTVRLGRRVLLGLTLAAFIVGNVLALSAVNFGMLVLARVITGSVHGLFVGVASMVAANLVTPERRGQAVAMVFGGIAVSTVVGVPLGTLVGQAVSWQAAFVGIVILAAIALVAVVALVPSMPAQTDSGLRDQAKFAFAPRVLAMLAVGLLLLGGEFAAFTYIASFLQDVTKVSGGAVSGFVLAFGVASAIGAIVGGRFADRNASATLLICNVGLVVALVVLKLVGASPIPVIVVLALWGLVGFGLTPAFQLRVISLAGPGGGLAATLGASAVNAGIAAGAAVGGWAQSSHGSGAVVVTGAVVCAVALPATWASRFLTPPSQGETVVAAAGPAAALVADSGAVHAD
ncbi:MFS transporter [Kitasatospora sp. NBC_01287]|uniref:MFS transporter n=1 Tax=Kitasatospora sp. NBC_01287 TaxID=2903573 RepID=UPI002254D671|nr:MFS transporter [Kitasatospora sp. NBC_01287]MCX4751377.1 MFS transporter [Kitasatospora sp. NBC_01287]